MTQQQTKRDKTVLVVGSGGREHAIVDALSRSERVAKIYCAPANGGITQQAEAVDIKVTDIEALAQFAKQQGVDLTVVGPEAALSEGIADEFARQGLKIFGPTKAAAQVESSKEFAKQVMMKYGIPTAAYEAFDEFEAAWDYVKNRPLPAVIKYDGLAAGKGVVVAESYNEAEAALKDMLVGDAFGKGRVVVEDFLDGPEFSFMCVVSGQKVYPLAMAQDHKRAFDGDKGPNTGGMGAYSPVPFLTAEDEQYALEKIMQPMASALEAEGVSFCGVLYGGLIKTTQGIKVIEFNARFGDPETEVVLPRLKSDIYELFMAAIEQRDFVTEWSEEAMLGVVMASKGYPNSYKKGAEIGGLRNVDTKVYHMGTAQKEGRTLTAGGRVLMVVGSGKNLAEASQKAMENVAKVECDELFFRHDIGHQVLD